jgi:hypothetical protein
MIAQLPSLNAILKRHAIQPRFWPEFQQLIEEGKRPGKELRTRLDHVANYKAALDEVMTELSKPLPHKFPAVTCYESLDLEAIAK